MVCQPHSVESLNWICQDFSIKLIEEDQMETLNIGNANISLVDNDIVIFEADPEIVIDKIKAQNFYKEIERNVQGEYSIIIHRKHRYQLLRMEVFDVINSQERLLAMSVVAPQESRKKMAIIEAPLCKKPFEVFADIESAVTWIHSLDKG